MHRRSRRFLVVALIAAGGLAAGCTSAVKAVPFDGADDNAACQDVAQLWPTTVADQPQRVTAVDSDTVAAWGDPAIIARCGAPIVGPTQDQCLDVAGIDWVAVRLDDGVSFTTFGRDPAIEVLVSSAYTSEALVMPAFTEAAAVIPQTLGECSS